MTRAPGDQGPDAGELVKRPNRRRLSLVPSDSGAEPPQEFVRRADDLVFLLELAPRKIRIETGVSEPDERAATRDMIARALAWGTQKDRWIVDGLQAVATFYSCRNATTFRRASGKLAALPVSPTVLFQLVQTTQVEAEADWGRLLAAHRGSRRGQSNALLKKHVIDKFREGQFKGPSHAAREIAKPFQEPQGSPELTQKQFGATLSPDRLVKTFEGWIRAWLEQQQ